jgi:hypothetical protein
MRPATPNARPPRRRTKRLRWCVAALAAALALAGCFSSPAPAPAHHHRSAATTVPTTATTTTTAPGATCPLTGSPVPGGGGVPQRPALAVKVTNFLTGRPQSGLNDADIVFEEPVEGGITRFVAVFYCQQAPLVGPIRSARNIDIGILGEFGAPLLAHVGGIQPVIDDIAASPLINVDVGAHGTVIQHPPGRVAPYSTYASTAALWGIEPTDTTPPPAVFTYSDTVPSGAGVSPVGTVAVPFSHNSTVVWRYDAKLHAFQRYYATKPDLLATGAQETAANVVVQFVQVTYGPWAENQTGGLEVQANLYDDASGPAEVFRSGVEVTGTWSRSSLSEATQFTSAAGQPISLQPGQTWVELVPDAVTVTATPPSG